MHTRDNKKVWLIIWPLLVMMMYSIGRAKIIYVDADANGLDDGSSWANAYNYLQDALVDARSDPDVNEIRVAAGVYTPDSHSSDPNGSGDRTATFQLINGVSVKGGYGGCGEGDQNRRDVDAYETILSGDLGGNDVNVNDACDLMTEPTRDENSYHIVIGSGNDETAILDGFTITAGNPNEPYIPNDRGGGMYNDSGNPTVTNCTFSKNSGYQGLAMANVNFSCPKVTNCIFDRNLGGMYNYGSSNLRVANCTFIGNFAVGGGGMANILNCRPTVTNCVFNGNATYGIYGGGGMFNWESHPEVTYCTFKDNSSNVSTGGGMRNHNSSPTVTNCTFQRNVAKTVGGGIANAMKSSPTVSNCTFSGNSADSDGGAITIYSSSNANITNCTLSGNSAGGLGGGMCVSSSDLNLSNSIIWGNSDSSGRDDIAQIYPNNAIMVMNYSCVQGYGGYGGVGNIDNDPLFVDANGPDNIFGTPDDNLRLLSGSPCIDTGDNNSVAADFADLDGDGNSTEPTPYDLDRHDRFADGDCNGTKVVDMGVYEFAYTNVGDFDHDCDVDLRDFAIFALAWLTEPGDERWNRDCDISYPQDSLVNQHDLGVFTENWLAGVE